MLKRSFSILPRVLKSKDSAAVKRTIQYITEDKTFKSILGGSKADDENVFVDDVLKLLNSSLPDVKKHQKTMDVHYSVLMNKLRGMVDKEIVYATVDVNKRIADCADANDLYRLIWEIQMDPLLRDKATLKHYYHIINSPNFSVAKCAELLDCIDMIKYSKTDIMIMAIYKLNNPTVTSKYVKELISIYPSLNQFSQKLTLRILRGANRLQELFDTQNDQIHTITGNHSQVVMIFQTLFRSAYKLPEHLIDESTELTPLQRSFCSSVRVLSEYSSAQPKLAKCCSQMVKASFMNKVSHCNKESEHSININEYKFLKYMEETLEDCLNIAGLDDFFYDSCRRILCSVRKTYTEESQLSLRLI
ncbi:Smt1p [Kluyveromyces lactis]|uniref:KLLA0A05929p n=1 Tax=Kluyveromyces lactis (strain ATCC 8585 / CBS 2359 / DSM 70799 / NBRC 1267 / NRRL Y-1140 / WM37) TaxID=284590 RepID=Q6CXS5_KLULA|nr:uncharacterized protein KLLA0_A05929g [Kluyveromyces lactis]CAH02852.1 KLLA0A05929p [Kluyveromyces lactis]|eukprot:XP_451264.1 uncharacterized protein KLLA0_A05929g [Kluyveromyces lactis]